MGTGVGAALRPRHNIAGHKNKALLDDRKISDETRRYIEDDERLISRSHTAGKFFDALVYLYPERPNPGALWFWGAKALFPQV